MQDRSNRLDKVAQQLDISPTNFQIASQRFNAVKNWLEGGNYVSGGNPSIYLQGSFRLGTVIRPFRGDRDGEFDIDQVCELTIPHLPQDPSDLKHDIGDRLKENQNYRNILDAEGKRCWTLEYSSDDTSPGFHLDVLPSTSKIESLRPGEISITDKDENDRYGWSNSNPNGYYLWFKSRNEFTDQFVQESRRAIFEENATLYGNEGEVPKRLLRSPLQRAIQILKRHRDVCFAQKDHKPISIIITTICAHLYTNSSISDSILRFVNYVTNRHQELLRDGSLTPDGILDYIDGSWTIQNPADSGKPLTEIENFADKWNVMPELSEAFFDWVYRVERDLLCFSRSGVSDDLNLKTATIGEGVDYSVLLERSETNGAIVEETSDLLDMIHLAIDGRYNWKTAERIAQRIYDEAENKDVPTVNFYQIQCHQGLGLSQRARSDIESIRARHSNDSVFVTCCNILLGEVSADDIQNCLNNSAWVDPFSWPIFRLVPRHLIYPR